MNIILRTYPLLLQWQENLVQLMINLFRKTINTFEPLSFRLENLGIKNGQQFFNDSKSTNIQSTQTALRSFEKKDVSLIIGGQVRDKEQINLLIGKTWLKAFKNSLFLEKRPVFQSKKISHPSMKIVDRLRKFRDHF